MNRPGFNEKPSEGHRQIVVAGANWDPGAKSHQCLLIDAYTEESDINALLSASENYMLERQEAAEIIEEVRAVIKDWSKTATELQIPLKLLGSYSMRWDEL